MVFSSIDLAAPKACELKGCTVLPHAQVAVQASRGPIVNFFSNTDLVLCDRQATMSNKESNACEHLTSSTISFAWAKTLLHPALQRSFPFLRPVCGRTSSLQNL